MGRTIVLGGALVSLVDVDFKCPSCGCPYTENDYLKQLYKSKKGLIYKKCKCCNITLGISSDMRGDTVVWLKSEETKNKGEKI